MGSGYRQFPAVSQCSFLIAPNAERARPCSPHPVPWLSQDQHCAYLSGAIRRKGELQDDGAVRPWRPFKRDQSPSGATRRDRVCVHLRIQYFDRRLPFTGDTNPVADELAVSECVKRTGTTRRTEREYARCARHVCRWTVVLDCVANINAIALPVNVLQDDFYASVILCFPGEAYRCAGEQHLRGELRLLGNPRILGWFLRNRYLGDRGARFLVDGEVHLLDGWRRDQFVAQTPGGRPDKQVRGGLGVERLHEHFVAAPFD